jgi:hypothetical protein
MLATLSYGSIGLVRARLTEAARTLEALTARSAGVSSKLNQMLGTNRSGSRGNGKRYVIHRWPSPLAVFGAAYSLGAQDFDGIDSGGAARG